MSENHDRAIGRIEGQLRLILDLNNRVVDNQNKAEIGRKQLYELLAALREEIADYKHRLDRLEARMDKLEKPVAALGKWGERGLGALTVISIIAALIGGTLATSWQKIIAIFR